VGKPIAYMANAMSSSRSCQCRRDLLRSGGGSYLNRRLDDVRTEEAYLGTFPAVQLYTGKRDRATGALRLFLGYGLSDAIG
jgi:hypothetical protein